MGCHHDAYSYALANAYHILGPYQPPRVSRPANRAPAAQAKHALCQGAVTEHDLLKHMRAYTDGMKAYTDGLSKLVEMEERILGRSGARAGGSSG